MNIYQKLVEVRKTVEYLKKEAQGVHSKYNAGSQVIFALRGKLDELGLLLIPNINSSEMLSDGKTIKLDMTMAWVDSEAKDSDSTIHVSWCAYGKNPNDPAMAMGSALTYSERYFLLKFFQIATDKDDPDKFQKQNNGKPEATQKPKQNPEDEQKKQEIIVKLNALLIKEVEAEVPGNATSDEKNKMFKEKLKEYSLWNETFAETGKELAKFSLKRIQTIYGKIKEANKGNHPDEIPF